MDHLLQKQSGAYFTPDYVADSLLRWVLRHENDRLLDPSCGDGQFIAGHRNSVGIEQDAISARRAIVNAPSALVHEGDFFAWAANTEERFECAAGNPPFIRYQTFKGDVRDRALALCAQLGTRFSGLASSWAPFLVATASLLLPGGRMSFVVPAEIGHAPYAAPLLEYLVTHFSRVHVVAVRDKLFPTLSEDCWLLHAEGFGGTTQEIRFSALKTFKPMSAPPANFVSVPIGEWRDSWKRRLRPYILNAEARAFYVEALTDEDSKLFGSVAKIGIGYVTGDNDFFHLKPSVAARLDLPKQFLQPTVRNGRSLPIGRLTPSMVRRWRRDDEQMLLLRLPKQGDIPTAIIRYLDSASGHKARQAYKCRVREPWYSVPDVQHPDFFLTYMSGLEPSLVRNDAGATCTNSVHCVRLKDGVNVHSLTEVWESPFVKLSCELEGHPLCGGMLKLEPREATQIVLPAKRLLPQFDELVIKEALRTLREWRHYATA